MERASGNYALVRRVIEIKRTSVNYSFAGRLHSNANAKLRLRSVVIFSLVREKWKAM